jgi:hypothetical protein
MSNNEILNRSYNLIITTILSLTGLGMALAALGEGDGVDRIDELGLLVVGLVALVWSLGSKSRFERSLVPLGLTLLALAFQVVGVVLEAGDKASFGDNLVGMVVLLPLTLFATWQYARYPTWARTRTSMSESHVHD